MKRSLLIFLLCVSLGIFLNALLFSPLKTPSKSVENTPKIKKPEYPSFLDDTMNKDLKLSCKGGDRVNLWEKPTDVLDNTVRATVPCGTISFAFNQYYNEKLHTTFYAIQTNDTRITTVHGWITEDLITWR